MGGVLCREGKSQKSEQHGPRIEQTYKQQDDCQVLCDRSMEPGSEHTGERGAGQRPKGTRKLGALDD